MLVSQVALEKQVVSSCDYNSLFISPKEKKYMYTSSGRVSRIFFSQKNFIFKVLPLSFIFLFLMHFVKLAGFHSEHSISRIFFFRFICTIYLLARSKSSQDIFFSGAVAITLVSSLYFLMTFLDTLLLPSKIRDGESNREKLYFFLSGAHVHFIFLAGRKIHSFHLSPVFIFLGISALS